jgi:putative oxidoreductase
VAYSIAMPLAEYHLEAAAFFPRVFLGFLFFFQGYDALFRLGIPAVIETFDFPLTNKGVPRVFLIMGSWYTSLAKLIGGLMLVFGLFTHMALYLLGLDLIFVAITFGIMRPLWDMQFVFPRLVLLVYLLVIPSEWNTFSLDYLFKLL